MDAFQLRSREFKLCFSGLQTKEAGGLREALDGDNLAPSLQFCYSHCALSFASPSDTKGNIIVITSIPHPPPAFVPKKHEK